MIHTGRTIRFELLKTPIYLRSEVGYPVCPEDRQGQRLALSEFKQQ